MAWCTDGRDKQRLVVTGAPEMNCQRKSRDYYVLCSAFTLEKCQTLLDSRSRQARGDYEIAPLEGVHQGHGTRATRTR